MRSAVLASLAASALATPSSVPAGLAEALQKVVQNTSATWNCSVSLSLKTANWEVNVADGIIDFDTMTKATPADVYAWGSVTKLLTGSNILKAVSEGAFDLDDEIMPFVDPFFEEMAKTNPKQGFKSMADLWGADNITGTTFRKLLHMTAGIPDFDTANPCYPQPCVAHDPLRANLYKTPAKGMSPVELMNVAWVRNNFKECKKSWAPEPFCYSSTNFMLLGMALAHRAKAASWEQYDQTLTLPPSLQKRAQFALSGGPSKYSSVHGYDRTQYNAPAGTHANHDNFDVSGVFSGWTASDIVTNVSTVANLAWEILGPPNSIAPKKYADMMNPGNNFYGLATHNLTRDTGRDDEYGVAYGHLGATYGYQGLVAWLPGVEATLAVATNIETDAQQQPAMAFCLGYNEALTALTGKKTSCTFKVGGYYGGGCKCVPFSEEAQDVIV